MAGALNPRRPAPKIRTCFRRPILMALLFCALSRGRMNCGKCRLAGNWLIVDDNDVGCSPRSSCPHADGRRWPPKLFPSTTRRSMRPALIVGERPMAALQSGRDVSAARPSRSEPLAPHPSRLACRKAPATNVDLRLKAAGIGPTNALTGLLVMQAYALLAAVRGALRRRRFKGLTGDDRTRCAGCWAPARGGRR